MAKKHTHQLTSAFDLFGKSYEIVMRNIKTFGILLGLPFLASIISTINYRVDENSSRWAQVNFFGSTAPAYSVIGLIGLGALLFFIAAIVIALIIQAMLFGLELEGARGKTPSLKHLFSIGKKFWLRLLGLAFMVALYVIGLSIFGVIILILFRHNLGFVVGLAWVIGAIIFVIQRYYLAPYVLIDQDLPVLDAMEHSANLAKNHAGAIWSVIGVSFLLSLTGIVPVLGPVISFILGSLYCVAPALRYEELKQLQ